MLKGSGRIPTSVSLRSPAFFLPRRFGPRASPRRSKGWTGFGRKSCDVSSLPAHVLPGFSACPFLSFSSLSAFLPPSVPDVPTRILAPSEGLLTARHGDGVEGTRHLLVAHTDSLV